MWQIDLGCGTSKKSECIGLDRRKVPNVDIIADVNHLPFRGNSIDKFWCRQLLEHFPNPLIILREIHKAMKKKGQVIISLPNFGTASAALDPTHKFITDGYVWNKILTGFFDQVVFTPCGVKYRTVSEKWIKWQKEMIEDGFYDLAQGFAFSCTGKNSQINYRYVPWFLEEEVMDMIREDYGDDVEIER